MESLSDIPKKPRLAPPSTLLNDVFFNFNLQVHVVALRFVPMS